MTKDTSMRLHRIFNIISAVSLVIAGTCLIAGCLMIYYGKGEYSREIVAETFALICVPVYICMALTVGGFIYEFISPLKNKKEKPERDYVHMRAKLLEKKNFSECDKALMASMEKERRIRRVHTVVRAVLVCICAAAFLSYGANPQNFDRSEINDSMIGAMWVLIPCLLASGGYAVFTAFYNGASIKREIEMLKKLPDAKDSSIARKEEKKVASVLVTVLRICIICAGIAILVYGALEGGFADVMTKAVNICTECIGLG